MSELRQGQQNNFSSIEDAMEDIRQGKMIIIVDDEDRENEGDLMIASEKGHLELVRLLVEKGADVSAKSKNGTIPLVSAAAGPRP